MAVQTFGIPSEEDQQQELVNSSLPLAGQPASITGTTDSALPSSTQATNGAPLPGADVQDGGAEPALQATDKPAGPARGERDLMKEAGTPTDQIKNMDGAKLVSTSERVLNDLKKARKGANPELLIGQGKQLNETLGATGASVDKAGEQWLEESEKSIDHDVVDGVYTKSEGKKKKFALRNIYSKIAPEEMGLFLMDFGLRAMMAGESMGTLGALGAAGSGALGALGERRAANEAKAVEDYKYGLERSDTEREFGLDERRVAADELRAKTAAQNAGRPLLAQWQSDFYRQIGYSDEQIGEIIAGGKTPTELVSESVTAFRKEKQRIATEEGPMGSQVPGRHKTTMPDGTKVPTAELTEDQIRELATKAADGIIEAGRSLREKGRSSEALNRALTNSQEN